MLSKYYHIVAFALTMATVAACHHTKENKALAGVQKLPKFKILALDSSSIVNSETLPEGRPSVFFYFDPECEHCQKETQGILTHHKEFKNVQFYFMSNSTPKEIDSFSKHFRLDTQTNIFVGVDYQFSFFNVFLPPSIPYMAIYSGSKNLIKIYYGEADMPSLIANTRN